MFGALALLAYRFLLRGPGDAERVTAAGDPDPGVRSLRLGRLPGHTVLVLAALALAACGAFVEDAGASWGALYLRVGFLISPSVVGVVADDISLRLALLSVVLAGLGVLLLGRCLAQEPRPSTTPPY